MGMIRGVKMRDRNHQARTRDAGAFPFQSGKVRSVGSAQQAGAHHVSIYLTPCFA